MTEEISGYFNLFLKIPGKSRFDVLKLILDELSCARSLSYSVVNFGAARHFVVSPAPDGVKHRARVVFCAHYDAAEGSEGANDNASGVFLLLSAASKLRSLTNWLIIFTDKEELTGGEGLCTQGSYLLARALKKTALSGADFYIFDACARGGTVVISTLGDYLVKKERGGRAASLKGKLRRLRNKVLECGGRVASGGVMLLPTPFSDDAGFLRAGLAAQTITALPALEAANFAQLTRVNPLYIKGLINSEFKNILNENLIPETWRIINTPADTAEKLDFECSSSMLNLIYVLAAG